MAGTEFRCRFRGSRRRPRRVSLELISAIAWRYPVLLHARLAAFALARFSPPPPRKPLLPSLREISNSPASDQTLSRAHRQRQDGLRRIQRCAEGGRVPDGAAGAQQGAGKSRRKVRPSHRPTQGLLPRHDPPVRCGRRSLSWLGVRVPYTAEAAGIEASSRLARLPPGRSTGAWRQKEYEPGPASKGSSAIRGALRCNVRGAPIARSIVTGATRFRWAK